MKQSDLRLTSLNTPLDVQSFPTNSPDLNDDTDAETLSMSVDDLGFVYIWEAK